ncbi:MAG: CRISPR-associated endonuclease Cas3'', partial [Chloroflexi bacterium]|nr:CRISPR-associated endonuclease Cas3'' [Chloroflexota bacterium]
ALHPALVHYDPDLGLSLTPGDRETPKANWARPRRGAERPARGRFSYQRETLEQHVARALDVIETRAVLWPRLAPLAPIIEAWLGWPAGLLRRILTAAVVMHDVGKLTPAWQAGIREVQKRRNRPWEPWLAHSDSEGDEDSNGPPARMPPHALSGAAHALDLARWLDAQVNPPRSAGRSKPSPGAVLFTAIATHHSPSVRTTALGKEELLDRAARHEASRLLQLHGFPGEVAQIEEGEQLGDQLVRTDDLNRPLQARELVALSLVIRLLRFADGWSQEWHTVPSTS